MAISNAFKFANNIISNGKFDANDLSVSVTGGPSLQAVKTSGFTAVANEAYPCNTTSSAFTVTLPATPSAGDEIIILDYAGTFDTNALTISPNGNKIEGSTNSHTLNGEREGVRLVYIDSTQGWLATSGINEGTDALTIPPYTVDFLVIAGGGSGGNAGSVGAGRNGGGGAGGYRNSFSTEASGGGGSSEASLSFIPGTVYTITVGAGGAKKTSSGRGNVGNDSSISGTGITTITSAGGGGGGGAAPGQIGGNGGSGGGAGDSTPTQIGGSGTANQGFAGGSSSGDGPGYNGGGGGGAGQAGVSGTSTVAGAGGNGLASSITGSSVTRAGGGGAGFGYENTNPGASGGSGGGGAGANSGGNAGDGAVNTGSGGGSARDNTDTGGAGGSGVVILRMPDANYSGTFTGSPTVVTGVGGTDTVIIFEESGSITG